MTTNKYNENTSSLHGTSQQKDFLNLCVLN